jgi:hypothetical protein
VGSSGVAQPTATVEPDARTKAAATVTEPAARARPASTRRACEERCPAAAKTMAAEWA